MSVLAIAGLVLFNFGVAALGHALLFALHGWRTWKDVARLAGLAYFLGLALLMVVFTLILVSGLALSPAAMAVAALFTMVASIGVGIARRCARPQLRDLRLRVGLAPISWTAAAAAACLVVYLMALFRSARLSSVVNEWDGWAFWLPKAQAIYFFDRLEPELISLLPPPSATYPPGLPAIHAGVFHAMGSADVVTLHLQYWIYAVAFVAALAGLLASRVRVAIVLPMIVMGVVMPSYVDRAVLTYADIPLGYLIVLAALVAYFWLETPERWQLAVLALLLGAATLTKREGALFALCVLASALLVSLPERRFAWPRIALAGAAAFAAALPWRLWSQANDSPSDAPEAGYAGFLAHVDRAWPSLKLVATTFFESDLWWVTPFVGVLALSLALLAKAWRISLYACTMIVLGLAAATWAIWANPSLPFSQVDRDNPVVRLVGTPMLLVVGLAPLLLHHALANASSSLERSPRAPGLLRRGSSHAWALVVAVGLAYPGSMALGYSGRTLPGEPPRFPSLEGCTAEPGGASRLQVVIGYVGGYSEAFALQRQASSRGLPKPGLYPDGCGRVRVSVRRLSPGAGRNVLRQALSAGFPDATLEADVNS